VSRNFETLLPPPALLDRLLSVVFWLLSLGWFVLVMPVMYVVALYVPNDRTEWLNRLYCWGQVFFTGSRYRVVRHPGVSDDVQYIFMQNHVNILDHVTMYNSSKHFKQGIELAKHFDYPIYGRFMKARGTIPVEPKSPTRIEDLSRLMKAEVDEGHSILAFPEGTRTRTGEVGPFKKGLFRICRDIGLPVVPVAVTGMHEVLATGQWLMRPFHTVTVHLLEPEDPTGMDDEQLDRLIQRCHDKVAGAVEDHRRALAAKVGT